MNKTGEDQGCDEYPHPEKQIKMHNIRKTLESFLHMFTIEGFLCTARHICKINNNFCDFR